MPTIGELIINLDANTASFVTQLESVKNISFDTAEQIQRSFSLIGTAALGMVSVAAGAMVVGIEKTAEWEVQILHLAQSAGTSVEAMSGLAFAAQMMGVNVDQVAAAMERFDKTLISAQGGNSKSQQNLSLLGIDPAQIKSSDDALLQLADHFAKLPDGAVKSAEAIAAFGKSGAAMIPILNLGKQGVQDFLDEAQRMGLVITKEQAEAAEQFDTSISFMKESLHALWVEITNATLPALNDLMAQFESTSKQKGFLSAVGEFGAALADAIGAGNASPLMAYMAQGEAVVATQQRMHQSVAQLSADFAAHQKALDALKKSYGDLTKSLEEQSNTLGVTNLQAKEYAINAAADAAGIAGLTSAQEERLRLLEQELTFRQQLAQIDNQTTREQKLIDTQNQLKADQQMADELKQIADASMQAQFSPTSAFTPAPEATQAFTDSINQQTAALEHSIDTFGMSAEAIARYDLAALDSSATAQQQIAQFKQLQDQLGQMQSHAKSLADAWKQFGDVAYKSLNDLIFSGKSFTQVLADITKQLGEMFLKWALFGFGNSNSGSGGGLLGAIAGGLKGIFGFAGGGSVSGGQPILVGEQGPEIFTPSTSGAIIPNSAIGGASINIVYQIDARGSSITEEQFRKSLALSENRAVRRALNASREVQLRTA